MITKSLPNTYRAGIQVHVWQLAQSVIRANHKVSLLVGGSFSKKQDTHAIGSLKIIRLRFLPGRLSPVLPLLLEDFSFNIRAFCWLIRHYKEFDVIHIHSRSGMIFGALAKWLKRPIVVTYHGITREEYKQNFGFKPLRQRLDAWAHQFCAFFFEKTMYQHAQQVITVSPGMKQALRKSYGTRQATTHVVSNGVFRLPCADRAHKTDDIIFVGRIEPIKGIFILPDILKHLPPHIQLHILGSGSAEKKLKALFEAEGLQDRVKWYGNVPQRQVMVRLQRMRALIVPSYLEPQGRVLLEAMSAGTPVVASDISGINDYVTHRETGMLFPKGNPRAAAAAILELIQHKELNETLAQNGQQYVRHHLTWDIVARQTIDIYQEADR